MADHTKNPEEHQQSGGKAESSEQDHAYARLSDQGSKPLCHRAHSRRGPGRDRLSGRRLSRRRPEPQARLSVRSTTVWIPDRHLIGVEVHLERRRSIESVEARRADDADDRGSLRPAQIDLHRAPDGAPSLKVALNDGLADEDRKRRVPARIDIQKTPDPP